MADVLTNKIVTIRKEQQCWGCTESFPKGTRLRYSKHVDGGVFQSAYWCRVCDATYDDDMDPYGDGIGFGEAIEWYTWEENDKKLPRTY